jgi:hypothetical protein
VGYVAWRGAVPENEAPKELLDVFSEKFTFYHAPGVQILA